MKKIFNTIVIVLSCAIGGLVYITYQFDKELNNSKNEIQTLNNHINLVEAKLDDKIKNIADLYVRLNQTTNLAAAANNDLTISCNGALYREGTHGAAAFQALNQIGWCSPTDNK